MRKNGKNYRSLSSENKSQITKKEKYIQPARDSGVYCQELKLRLMRQN
jgi:hypothetical protein